MDRICSPDEFRRFLQEIKSSDVVEVRVDLLTKLYHLNIPNSSDFGSLAECLVALWEDFTCLDASQCMLNKAILDVAAKYVEVGCLGQYLLLGTKAAVWSEKHLNMTLASSTDSQEEHSNLYFQLLLKLMAFSVTAFSVMVKQASTFDPALMAFFVKFVSHMLDLVNVSVSEVKRIHSFRSEILKGAQTVIEGVTGVCRAYWEGCVSGSGETADGGSQAERVNSTIGVVKCAVEKLCQLGVVAAGNGGSLVTILNVSWKAVVSLLQLGKGALAVRLEVSGIILSLVSLAKDSLLSAADTWLSPPPPRPVSLQDARRTLVPAKFYLVNAVRISLLHPLEVLPVSDEVADCLFVASASLLSLSSDPLLRGPAQALAELLQPPSFALAKSVLNSSQLEGRLKLGVIDRFFPVGGSLDGEDSSPRDGCRTLASKLCASAETTLLLGRVGFFLNLLEGSRDLGEASLVGLAGKLEWLLDTVVRPEVYSATLYLAAPIVYDSGESREVEWRPLFSRILHSVKTFLLVADGSSGRALDGPLNLLLGCLVHPHFLRRELAVDLLSFVTRHSGPATADRIFDLLLSWLTHSASRPELLLEPRSPLRALAGSVGLLIGCAPRPVVDRVCCGLLDRGDSLAVLSALVAEGLPLEALSEKVRDMVKGKIGKELALVMDGQDLTGLEGGQTPLLCAAAASQSLMLREKGIGSEVVPNLVRIVRCCKDMADGDRGGRHDLVLGKLLELVSYSECAYRSGEIGKVVFALRDLFSRSGPELVHSRAGLALFLPGLALVDLPETEGNPLTSASRDLFHVVLRERHWAGAHLAVSSFGRFAARTSCGRLWRFVPSDAALSFDPETGEGASEDRFMLELKAFLEKGAALAESEEAGLLSKEAGRLLESSGDPVDPPRKKRKLPERVVQGAELMREGLEAVSAGISQLRCIPFDDGDRVGLLDQFSVVRDVVDRFLGLVKGKMV